MENPATILFNLRTCVRADWCDQIAAAFATLQDFSQMAEDSTDPDPAYRRAYADIAKWVRERASEFVT